RTDTDAAHRFGAASDRHFVLSRHNLGRGEVDCIKARGTKPVDLNARHTIAKTGNQGRRARNVPARFADRVDTTQHDIIHKRRVELVAILDGRQHLGAEVERGYFMRRSVSLATSTRAANGVVDKCLGHELFSSLSAVNVARGLAITSFAQSTAS